MSWDEKKEKLVAEARAMAAAMEGKKILQVSMLAAYPGHYSVVRLVLEDGSAFEVMSGGGGCSECDPEGIGFGVNVELCK